MRLIRVCLFCLISCWATIGSAQVTNKKIQTIHYKDGSIFRGKALNQSDSEVLFLLSTGDTLHLDRKQILNKYIQLKNYKKYLRLREPKFHYDSGLFASLEMSRYSGYSGDYQFDFIVGHRLDQKYSIGIGMGQYQEILESTGLWERNQFYPIFTYARRYFMIKDSAKPFVFIKAGYGFAKNIPNTWTRNHHSGGPHFQYGVGINFASRNKIRFLVSLSQYFQHTSGSQILNNFQNDPAQIDYSVWHTGVKLKVAVEFN